MEGSPAFDVSDGKVNGIKFGLATHQEIRIMSNSDFAIGHATQLSNPFLGLPLESGNKCESCGTAEPGKCDGHFGFIELPIPIYHPRHISELKRMLSLLCLSCLKIKKNPFLSKRNGIAEKMLNPGLSCCEDLSKVAVKEVKTSDGAYFLELKLPSKSNIKRHPWKFLERYGFSYGEGRSRPLLPSEVIEILKKIPYETRKKLASKKYFPQEGYILRYIPVPPNCLSIPNPDFGDGTSVMSSDFSVSLLKKVLKQVEVIKSSRSGVPNFESQEVEANDLQATVSQYLEARGIAKVTTDRQKYGIKKETNESSTKAWLEKMRTLFIRKGSGFSSRSVITGDAYRAVNEIGIPFEIAQRITFEEKVNVHNMTYLQKLVDDKLCLMYRDGSSMYSLREGSKGHTFLRPGQVVHRRIMDGDIVFINRPPTTHKHSLQAFSVYVHDDHTVKINPLICGPLSADFDGDCVHLFYPQSLAAKAEVLELFSVERQLLSSHSGSLNLQVATDALLSLKAMFRTFLFNEAAVQQLSMFVSASLPPPAVFNPYPSRPLWTALQVLNTTFPSLFDCCGEKHLIIGSELLRVDVNRQSFINEIVSSVFFERGPKEVLSMFNALQPLLMEYIFSEGFSVGLEDFSTNSTNLEKIQGDIQVICPLLSHLRSKYNESLELEVENHMRRIKGSIANFILEKSALGNLIDPKSESAITKVLQQIGYLGLQLSDRGKFYTKILVDDMASLFRSKCKFDCIEYPSGEYGLIKSCFFRGLNPFEEMVHSISSREVLVRSSRGLTEPGTLFKNLMAILRDVVICYDGTVRNVCSNSIIQFGYGSQSLFPAGEPVGVLAATAMSNPAYKAVLDSSASSNSSWDLMKEILLSKVNFRNDIIDRRVILYLNECGCERDYCQEKAACLVQNELKKVELKDVAVEFLIEYANHRTMCEEIDTGLTGHIHLNKILLQDRDITMLDIFQRCEDTIRSHQKKKKFTNLFKRLRLFSSECCNFQPSCGSKWSDCPCLWFSLQDMSDGHLERTSRILSDMICPVLLETVIKGDPRVCSVDIIWVSPDSSTWIRNSCKSKKGEWALDVVLRKAAVKQSGDAWRVFMDCCLPIIHLIDTRRSIPYAIKQVQELLGISCAFDQAVQRLSASVAMVTKGVLKEHLMLLGNSMTCGGDLIGFNVGGYKAFSRSLNTQVPFTDATLFTPKRCFERAAEKCSIDSLSSVVGSCSWGKHVAVGTGSRFDVLWGKKEAGLTGERYDVYSLLHLVRGSSDGGSSTGCLGVEVDKLNSDEDIDAGLSPVHGLEKPVFEDAELHVDIPRTSWDSVNNRGPIGNEVYSSWDNSETGSQWDQPKKDQSEMEGQWGQQKKDDNEMETKWGQQKKDDNEMETKWGQQKKDDNEMETKWGQQKKDKSNAGTQWGYQKKDNSEPEIQWGLLNKDHTEAESQWGQAKKDHNDGGTPWNEEGTQWGQPKKDHNEGGIEWGQLKKDHIEGGTQWEQSNKDKSKAETQWGQPKNDHNEGVTQWGEGLNQWGQPKKEHIEGGTQWGQSKKDHSDTGHQWGHTRKDHNETEIHWSQPKKDQSESGNQWGQLQKGGSDTGIQWSEQKRSHSEADNQWGQSKKSHTESPHARNRREGWIQGVQQGDSTVNKDHNENPPNEYESWNKNVSHNESSQNWDGGYSKSEQQSQWCQPRESSSNNDPTESLQNQDQGWNERQGQDQTEQQSQWSQSKEWASEKVPAECLHKWDQGNKCQVQDQWDQRKESIVSKDSGESSYDGDKGWNDNDGKAGWGQQRESSLRKNYSDSSPNWGPPRELDQLESLHGLCSSNAGGGNENEKSSQWGQQTGLPFKKGRPENSRGWGASNAGDWKNKNRPARPPRMFNDDSPSSSLFTATRQRLDLFTTDDQVILSDVEPIMQSVRRIMYQSSYNDGDPLSAEDQSYVLDNVFNHHPDKAVKMGAGIDHLMVNKHGTFQESKCFFLVKTGGHKEDFSYLKCLENYVRVKYPDQGESFIPKYFKRRSNRRELQASPGPSSEDVVSIPDAAR